MDIKRPAKVIGTNTVGHLQSGLYFGYIGLVDGILERIFERTGRTKPRVIATGGLARHDRGGLALHLRRSTTWLTTRRPAHSVSSATARHAPAQPEPSLRLPVLNYFNYFTEIEERFQQRRGALLLLSTLDWALIETWREAGDSAGSGAARH